MEESIDAVCQTLASFCNHLESSCNALKQSLEQRPIPLDSASSTFVQCLNRRVSSASSDLNLLESMSFGTVSFEELLGHCNEVYKKNQNDLAQLEDRLSTFGYIPEPEIDEEEELCDDLSAPVGLELKTVDATPLLDDSFSFQDLGLSDVSLATIASEANKKIDLPDISSPPPISLCEREHEMKEQYEPTSKSLEVIAGEMEDDLKSVGPSQFVINVTKDDYESLPSFMRSLATWEDLLAAVEKMNVMLNTKQKTKGGNFFYQDELASLGLGPKVKSYLMLLLRLNSLVVETIDGLISYRVL